MPLNLSVPPVTELKPKITVIGVGGAGGNAVNNMIVSELDGVEFVVANTDAQAVGLAKSKHKIQLGSAVTQGLGAGSQPDIGRAAAEESLDEIIDHIEGSNMLFITAGMGGGTGTGAAPVIARAARERNILTVGVITKPFHFEGARRMRIAEEGIRELQSQVDTLIIIPNQNLFRVADERTTFADAFAMADEVLHSGVRGITDLMIVPGLINLDFADVRSVMSEMGKAMMGTGEAEGDKRAAEAADAAISNPLLDEVSMKGAQGVLINITGGMDMKLFEVDEAANRIRAEVDPDANIIVGSTFSHELEGKMRVSVVATGIEAEEMQQDQPTAKTAPSEISLKPAITTGAVPVAGKDLLGADDMFEAVQDDVAARKIPKRASASSILNRPAENPVGSVHDHIRKMLTEDEEKRVAERAQSAGQPSGRKTSDANPFRGRGPLNAAMDILKETFGGAESADEKKPIAKRRAERSAEGRKSQAASGALRPALKQTSQNREDLFAEDADADLDIPAFLRRRGDN
jgi:cell division protein FtsZ